MGGRRRRVCREGTERQLRQKPATKEKKGEEELGGGVVLSIKRNLGLRISWKEKGTEELLAATWEKNGKRWLWGVVYTRHTRRENYELMEEWDERDKEQIIILTGDSNARTVKEAGLE